MSFVRDHSSASRGAGAVAARDLAQSKGAVIRTAEGNVVVVPREGLGADNVRQYRTDKKYYSNDARKAWLKAVAEGKKAPVQPRRAVRGTPSRPRAHALPSGRVVRGGAATPSETPVALTAMTAPSSGGAPSYGGGGGGGGFAMPEYGGGAPDASQDHAPDASQDQAPDQGAPEGAQAAPEAKPPGAPMSTTTKVLLGLGAAYLIWSMSKKKGA
jgi:hypothetical protein